MHIKAVTLRDGKRLEFGQFNVIVGPNAVGKTTLALELFAKASHTHWSQWFWLSEDVECDSDDPRKDLELFRTSLVQARDGNQLYYVSLGSRNVEGHPDASGTRRLNASEFASLGKLADLPLDQLRRAICSTRYRSPFITLSGCDSRLTLPTGSGISAVGAAISDPLNVLFRHPTLLKALDARIMQQFKKHLVLLDHTITQLELGLSAEPAPHIAGRGDLDRQFEEVEKWKDQNFTPIQRAGHGIRSMVKLLLGLLDPINQVLFIDEPELHIYPSQKRWLGRELVALSRNERKQVFIVTHDPTILQGVLDAPTTTHIFRIDTEGPTARSIRRCELNNLADLGAQRNREGFLRVLFYQRFLAVEGASDRAFYQNLVENFFEKRLEGKELGYIDTGGKGAAKNVLHIARQVRARGAFILDFDALFYDLAILSDMLSLNNRRTDAIDALAEHLKKQHGSDAKRIRVETENAAMKGLTAPYVIEHAALFRAAIDDLEEADIFIVPNGSLESWAPAVEAKVRFAELAPPLILKDDALKVPLEAFLSRILAKLDC